MDAVTGNKLIAIFMGMIEEKDGRLRFGNEWHETLDPSYQLYYNTEWNHLIPVVEKIEQWEDGVCSFFIVSTECDIAFSSKNDSEGEDFYAPNFAKKAGSKITSTWQSVVHFIQWYNQQQTKNKEG